MATKKKTVEGSLAAANVAVEITNIVTVLMPRKDVWTVKETTVQPTVDVPSISRRQQFRI